MLARYCQVSGQRINYDKSSLKFSSNCMQDEKQLILEVFGCEEMRGGEAYLGMPILWGKSRRVAMNYIVERVKMRAQGWKHRLLSQAGKEVMIKAVLQALPAYTMSVFKLSKQFLIEIECIIGKFMWGSGERDKKINWIGWDRLTKAKK